MKSKAVMASDATGIEQNNTTFPISRTKKVVGTRRLVREKAMQILVAHFISNTDTTILFNHIFCRDFNSEDADPTYTDSTTTQSSAPLLTDAEILDISADASIEWYKDNIVFGSQLIASVIKHYDFIVTSITEVSENWHFDRISIIDRAIICVAAAEFIDFPDIPIKATINEAIELAKSYSSDKSYVFINGVLEKLKTMFSEKNLISKSERGKK